MKLPFVFLLIFPLVAQSQILMSNFSDLAGQAFSPFDSSWYGGSPAANQFSQDSGFVSFLPVSGGNPTGTGSLIANIAGSSLGSNPVSFSGVTSLSLTVRVDTGNASTSVSIEVLDSSGTTSIGSAQFAASSFTSTFSTITAPFVLTGNGNVSTAAYWTMSGDANIGNPTDFRMSFDNLTAIPETSTGVLVGLGLVAVFLSRKLKASLN